MGAEIYTDSASEQLAIKKAFPGVKEGELQPLHLLCTVHSDRTLRRKVRNSQVANLVRKAMYATTRIKCEDTLAEALTIAQKLIKDINPNYLNPIEKAR